MYILSLLTSPDILENKLLVSKERKPEKDRKVLQALYVNTHIAYSVIRYY
jgi:hypothetical protein